MGKMKDKIAIVTGAGSGIGKALALELLKKGAIVVVTDIHEDRLRQVVSELKQKNVRCSGYKVDHSNYEDVKSFHLKFMSDFPKADILCLNAGIGVGGKIEEMDIEKWEKVMGINFWGVVYMIQLFVKGMIRQKSGGILITASIAGLVGTPGMSAYCASKFGVVGIAESLRAELKNHNIGVTALCPGIIRTNIIKDGHIGGTEGGANQSTVDEFFQNFGSDPESVAQDGIKALEKNIGIMPTPWNVYVPWLAKKLSEDVYTSIMSLVWKRMSGV